MKLFARDVMTGPAITVTRTTRLMDVARLMLDRHVGSVLVVDADGALCGIVTDTTFSARERFIPFSAVSVPQVFSQWLERGSLTDIYASVRHQEVATVMTSPVHALAEDASIEQVLELMLRHDIYRVPIVREGRPVGIVSRHDLLRIMLAELAGDSTR